MKIIDISLSLNERTIIYPGNPPVSLKEKRGATSVHTEILIGSHTGTHLDAPSHIFEDGENTGSIDLEKITGYCRVLDMTEANESIKVSDLEKSNIKSGEIILVKTRNSQRGFEKFYNDYIYLDGEAADYLAEKSIAVFGIDYLSIKKRGGKDNRPHTSLLKKNIIIFEGLDLSNVKSGSYFFVGLPLKFTNIDGSPVRAILIDDL